MLYEKGYNNEEIFNLYRFIDWIMLLPKECDESYHSEITKYKEERKMPYITTAERIGIRKGKIEGITKGITKGKIEGKIETLNDMFSRNYIPKDTYEEMVAILQKELAEIQLKNQLELKELEAKTLNFQL